MKRMAVLVGCNYPNTSHELHGCINDVVAMRDLLIHQLGFDQSSIELLTDGQGSKVMPTGVNIKKALDNMIDQAEVGDVLFFHYSGHGTRIPSKLHFKQEEAIVPCDFNLITDVDFRQLVNRLPQGVSFTILSDSCHSGGLIDKEKEQVGPNSLPPTGHNNNNQPKPKYIPVESISEHLANLTKIIESDIGAHLRALFKDYASPSFLLPEVYLGLPFGKKAHGPDSGILLSGCQPNETSADMPASGPGGEAHGAFSYAIQSVFKTRRHGPITNREVVVLAREILKGEGVEEQHPCLYCSDENVNAPFLLWDVESKK